MEGRPSHSLHFDLPNVSCNLRKGALFVAAVFSFASVIGAAYTSNW